jgi:hypothetical protein
VQTKKPIRGPFASAGNSPLAERELLRAVRLVGFLLAAAVLTVCWPFSPVGWPTTGAVTKANYDQVSRGMPEERVAELLGPDSRPVRTGSAYWWGDEEKRVYWTNDTGTTVAVSFDRNGRVLVKQTLGVAADWDGPAGRVGW